MEQAEPLEEVVFIGQGQRREPNGILGRSCGRLGTRPTARADVSELLDNLDGRAGSYETVSGELHEGPRWGAERVLRAEGVDEDRRVEDDHAKRRPRIVSSSSPSSSGSGTSIGSASRIACNAVRRLSASPGNRSSIASRTNTATDTPRRPASRSRRDQRSSSIKTCKRRSSMLI